MEEAGKEEGLLEQHQAMTWEVPMYMAIGFPAHVVTGTNQCSIFFGGATSLARDIKAKRIHWPTAWLAGPLAVLGAFLGARLNLIMPERILEIIAVNMRIKRFRLYIRIT